MYQFMYTTPRKSSQIHIPESPKHDQYELLFLPQNYAPSQFILFNISTQRLERENSFWEEEKKGDLLQIQVFAMKAFLNC